MSETESKFRERRSAHTDEPSEPELEPTPTIGDDAPPDRDEAPAPAADREAASGFDVESLESAPLPEPSLVEIAALLAEQAAVFLRGVPVGPGDERKPLPNQARHFIDLVTVLDEKTSSSQTPEESQQIEQILSQLRLAYLRVAG